MKEWFYQLFNRGKKNSSTYLKYEDGEIISLKTSDKNKLKDDLIKEKERDKTTFQEETSSQKKDFQTQNSNIDTPNIGKRFSKVLILLFLIILFASFCQFFYYFISKNTTIINGDKNVDNVTKKVEGTKENVAKKEKEKDLEAKSVSKITPSSEEAESKEKELKPIFSFGQKSLKVEKMTDKKKELLSLSSETHNFLLDSLLNLKSEVIFYEKGKSNQYIFTNETDSLAQHISNAKKSLLSKEKEMKDENMSAIFTNLHDRLVALDGLVQTLRTIGREQIIDTTNEYIGKENNASDSYQAEFKKVLDSYGINYKTIEGKITYEL
ncbi:hypothetical protein [Bacillus sp. NPDC094106]|uniref:hypothetical protein n=1 Tax=Bacillus sp. NPDC094106 TaxID=3363949 RepID=UPI003810132F